MAYQPLKLEPGDRVRLRRAHPCGGSDFEIVRAGMDFRLRCLQCGSQIRLPRKKLEKMISLRGNAVDKDSGNTV